MVSAAMCHVPVSFILIVSPTNLHPLLEQVEMIRIKKENPVSDRS